MNIKKYKFLKFLKVMVNISLTIFFSFAVMVIFSNKEDGSAPVWSIACWIIFPIVFNYLIEFLYRKINGYSSIDDERLLEKKKKKEEKKRIKEEKKLESKKSYAERKKEREIDNTITKIVVLGTNQAFNTSFITGITYNDTEYTCKVTYASGRTDVVKLRGRDLKKYSDLIETK